MAIELITGRAGKAHIGSEDDRAYHAYTNGEGRYILHGGTANIESANNVHVDPAEFLVDGAHVRVTGAGEDVAIENGVASYKRIDVIALHYTRTGNEDNYVESVEFAVVKGANVELGSEAQVPDMPKSGTILTGSNDVYIPVYSLLIDGLTPKNLATLLKKYALPVAHGGTGATTERDALANLGAIGFGDLKVTLKYTQPNIPVVQTNGIDWINRVAFIELGEIEGTNTRFLNRFEYESILQGGGAYIPEGTMVAPAGSIPKHYLKFCPNGIDLTVVAFRDTTLNDIYDTAYNIRTNLRVNADGSITTKQNMSKYRSENMTLKFLATGQFFVDNEVYADAN